MAFAVLDLFPKTELVEDWVQHGHFCYQFIFRNKASALDLKLIEDRMLQIEQQGFNPYLMEMIPKNAAELFKSVGQHELVRRMHDIDSSTVKVVRFNHYYDLCQEPIAIDSQKIPFKLSRYELNEDSLIIFGMCSKDKEGLKVLIKQDKQLQKNLHTLWLEDLEIFKGEVFLPAGCLMIENLKSEINNEFEKNNFKPIDFIQPVEDLKKSLSSLALLNPQTKYFLWGKEPVLSANPLDYGLFQLEKGTYDQWISVVDLDTIEQECISCLKFYEQIIKILGFSYRVKYNVGQNPTLCKILEKVFELSQIEAICTKGSHFEVIFEMVDRYGRALLKPSWRIEKIAAPEGKKGFVLIGAFCNSLEKLLALMLEQSEGELALKWCPKQLAILTLGNKQKFAQTLYDYFKKNRIKVSIDSSTEKLSAKLYQACKEKIPYVAIVGEKEQELEELTVKLQRSHRELKCSKEKLLEYLEEELKEI